MKNQNFPTALLLIAALIAFFSPAVADLENFVWSDQFFIQNGCTSDVNALVVISESEIALFGSFTECAGIDADRAIIVNTEQREWRPLGSASSNGLNGTVYAAELHQEYLYVGGLFSQAFDESGAINVNRVARWNLSNERWERLGTASSDGVNGTVHSIKADGSSVYIGGSFSSVGGDQNIPSPGIALFANESWETLGNIPANGVNGSVRAIHVSGQDVYVGGIFTTSADANSVMLNNVGKWSESGLEWEQLATSTGVGVDNAVRAITSHDGGIYIGGDFDFINSDTGIRANSIAIWADGVWETIPSFTFPGNTGVDGAVFSLTSTSIGLVITGLYANLTTTGGVTVWNLSVLDEDRWTPIGADFSIRPNDAVFAAVENAVGQFFFGGRFAQLRSDWEGANVNGVVSWDIDRSWTALGRGQGIDGEVNAIIEYEGIIYAGGDFQIAGDRIVDNLAAWNGSKWMPVGSLGWDGVTGFDAEVFDLHVVDDRLLVGGRFSLAKNNGLSKAANNLVYWDPSGNEWQILGYLGGNGVSDAVYGMDTAASGLLYIGGEFTSANVGNSITANRVVAYDGFEFFPLSVGSGNGVSSLVLDVASIGEIVYFGGIFDTANSGVSGGSGISANNVVGWNGADWIRLGASGHNGVNGGVDALEEFNGALFVGGLFDTAFSSQGSVPVNNIGVWRNDEWEPVGSAGGNGTSFGVNDLFNTQSGSLLVGGNFSSVNLGAAIPAINVAEWTGSDWIGWPNNGQPSVTSVWGTLNRRFIGTNQPINDLGESRFAEFSLPSYTVTPNSIGDGLVEPASPQTVFLGNSISFDLEPGSGMEVNNIEGDCAGIEQAGVYLIDSVERDCSFTVIFDVFGLIFRNGFEEP